METSRKHFAVPAQDVPIEIARMYWTELDKEGLISKRLCDMTDPTIEDAVNMFRVPGQLVYYVMDTDLSMLTAEFMLNAFTGKSAQVHFSMHPINTPQYSMMLARTMTNDVLNEWIDTDGNPYLYSLYGLTPVTNRAACAFVRRVGFKKMGLLPRGQWSEGEAVDAMITLKVRNGHGK